MAATTTATGRSGQMTINSTLNKKTKTRTIKATNKVKTLTTKPMQRLNILSTTAPRRADRLVPG